MTTKRMPGPICSTHCISYKTAKLGLSCLIYPGVSMQCVITVLHATGEIDEGSAMAAGIFCRGSSGDACDPIQQWLCFGGGTTLSHRAIAQFAGDTAGGGFF